MKQANALMKYYAAVKKFFASSDWQFWLAILAVVAVAALVIYLIKKRREKKSAQKETALPAEAKPAGLPASSLYRIWKNFLKAVPRSVRPTFSVYDHFIVLGEAGSGKSTLIDRYTDWQGHARQFYPSYTADPLLQIYLGSKALVQEVPSALMNDISQEARRALVRLWKPIFRRKDPVVVIVLDGLSLLREGASPEYLKQMAQKMRGKINLLSHFRHGAVKVRLVLTHLDLLEGFAEFAGFLANHLLPFKLEFNESSNSSDIAGFFAQFEQLLPRALVTLSADRYLKAMTFLRQSPALLEQMSLFKRYLEAPDPLSLNPDVTTLYFISGTEEEDPVLNPFASTITSEELEQFDPLFKHRMAAAAIGIAGIVYLGGSFFYERSALSERTEAVEALEIAKPIVYSREMHRNFSDAYRQSHPVLKFLPDYFAWENREIDRRLVESIRKLYLLPELNRLLSRMPMPGTAARNSAGVERISGAAADSHDKTLYLLGLLYADRENALGKVVSGNRALWSDVFSFSEVLIEDYVRHNDAEWPPAVDLKMLSLNASRGQMEISQDWLIYFDEIQGIAAQSVLTKAEFEKLQRDTDRFLRVIRLLDYYQLSAKVAYLLKKESGLAVDFDLMVKRNAQLEQPAVREILDFIKSSDLTYPNVTADFRMSELYENLKVMTKSPAAPVEKEKPFQFVLAGREFKLYARQWTDVINASKTLMLLRDFMRVHARQSGLLFFATTPEFEDLVMNASNDGRFLFTGHARVDGRFTKEAVEKRVKPTLMELPPFIDSLNIPQRDKSQFLKFLRREVDFYGRRYAQYYRKYYLEFDIKANSPGALRFVLSQMILPSSPLTEILVEMRNNTRLDFGKEAAKNDYLELLNLKLTEFEFLTRLMGEKTGSYPELDKYRTLLEQMQADLQDSEQKPADRKDKEDAAAASKSMTSPVGKISFAIFNGDKDSYLSLVRQWLNSVGMPRQWQDIFLAPVWQAYFIGMSDMQAEIDRAWKNLTLTDIQPLYGSFPFEREASADVSIDVLKNATHPQGHFWQTFQTSLKPFLYQEGGKWKRRAGPHDFPKLPGGMVKAVNDLAQLSALFWDKDGKERPLELTVKPGPLPSIAAGEPIAALSYLQVGDSAVLGFNQKPAWKKLKFSWTNQNWASAGLECEAKEKGLSRIKRSVEIPASYWSLYHLLKETVEYQKPYATEGTRAIINTSGNGNGDGAETERPLTWIVNSPATASSSGKPMMIRFYVQGDPWAPFKLSR